MNCPKCNSPNCRYIQRQPPKVYSTGKSHKPLGARQKGFKRTDFRAKCKNCGVVECL